MAQTVILAPSTAAGTSSDITVTSTPVTVTLIPDTDAVAVGRVKAKIEIEIGEGVWEPFIDGDVTRRNKSGTYLYQTQRSYTLKTPGVFRLVKDETAQAVGAVMDTAA